MGELNGTYQHDRESPHDAVRNHAVGEQGPERPKCFPTELEDQANMVSIRAFMLKIVHQMGNVLIAGLGLIPISKPLQNLSFEDIVLGAVAFGTKNFEGQKFTSAPRAAFG